MVALKDVFENDLALHFALLLLVLEILLEELGLALHLRNARVLLLVLLLLL